MMELFHVLIQCSKEKGDNALFNIIASIDDETNAIIYQNCREEVFAPSFFIHTYVSSDLKNYARKGCVLEAYCSENAQTTEEGKSRFILEYGRRIIPVAYVFKSGWNGSSPGDLYGEIAKRGLVSFLTDTLFFPYDERDEVLYDGVKLKNGTAVPNVGKELNNYSIDNNNLLKLACKVRIPIGSAGFGELLIVPKSSIDTLLGFPQCGKTDMMTDGQLFEWLKRRLANTSEVDADDLREVLRIVQSESTEEPDCLIKQRLTRCMALLKTSFFTDSDFKWIFESRHYPELRLEDQINTRRGEIEEETKKAVISSAESQRNEIIEKAKAEARELKIEMEARIEAISNELKTAETELSMVRESISTEREELSVIQSDKKRIISEIRIVAGLGQGTEEKESNTCDYCTSCDGDRTVDVDDPDELYQIIKAKLDTKYRKAISEILYYQWSFVPDVVWAHLLAHYCGNCCVKTITVEHGWYGFDRFVSAGLIDFWNHAWDYENTNHILILQNLNIIPPECALQSLLDLADERRPELPNSRKPGVPENLRIVATILPCKDDSSIGLPLRYDSFRNWQIIGDRAVALNLNLLNQTKYGEFKVSFNSIDIRPHSSEKEDFLKYVEY